MLSANIAEPTLGRSRSTQSKPATHFEPITHFPILVAVSDDEVAPSVLRVAESLAAQRSAEPSLLYVMNVVPYATADGGMGMASIVDELTDPITRQRDENELRVACHADTGAAAAWPFDIELGSCASCIVSRAYTMGAQLIVAGLRHHGLVDRALSGSTIRALMAMGKVPVLAVRSSLVKQPASVVVAVDFSKASLRAARLARRIMADNGTMHLIFVAPSKKNTPMESEEGQQLIQTKGVDAAFEQFVQELKPTGGIQIVPVQRQGDPVSRIKAICTEVGADLVAIGSQRHSLMERLRVGRVATAMIDDGRWSVLVTPPGY